MKLLTEKDFYKISIKEIAESSDVDRKTVYNYYKDVNLILEDIQKELVENFEKEIDHLTFDSGEDGKIAFFLFSKLLSENMETYSLILKNDHSVLIDRITDFLKRKVRLIMDKSGAEVKKIELAMEFLVAGIIAAYRSWFNSEYRLPLEVFTENLARLILVGAPAYFHGNKGEEE